jgi:hypothetical protein
LIRQTTAARMALIEALVAGVSALAQPCDTMARERCTALTRWWTRW